ncbi:hypothetical protein BH23GEM1_BH23GEM1_05560 [soil metagenome]
MGETRVDLLHLLEDLADAYPGALEETVLTEMVANSLDSGASAISLLSDPVSPALTVTDNGAGMRRAELRRFHDVAASVKTRGEGIGFAGVGIKLGLLVSAEVVTESRRGKDHVATTWALASRKRAPWRWVPPEGMIAEHGTAVRLRLENALSPLLDPGFLETVLRRHFAPLFEPFFDDILRPRYPEGVRFAINGHEIGKPDTMATGAAPIMVRLARKRKPSAFGYLVREPHPIADDAQGIAISTLGKVIKRGWDWLGVTPAAPDRVTGLIEAPALSACLTLNKADFLRSGPRGATYLAYRKALQEAASNQFAEWGDTPESGTDQRRRAARPVERDVEHVLVELAGQFPMLAMLVERRAGGRKKLPGAEAGNAGDGPDPMDLFSDGEELAAPPPEGDVEAETPLSTPPSADGEEPALQPPETPSPAPEIELPSRKGSRRPARLGLTIQFDSRPDDAELGRLIETTVWVNDAHPAYRRAAASRSEGYHIALSVAMALAGLAAEPAQERAFVTAFLARWGESVEHRSARRAKRSRKRG